MHLCNDALHVYQYYSCYSVRESQNEKITASLEIEHIETIEVLFQAALAKSDKRKPIFL